MAPLAPPVNDQPPQVAPPRAAPKGTKTLAAASRVVTHLSVGAVVSWAAGMAAHVGWHASLPFGATWAAYLAAIVAAAHFTRTIAAEWHEVKGEVEPLIAAKVRSMEAIADHNTAKYIEAKLPGVL